AEKTARVTAGQFAAHEMVGVVPVPMVIGPTAEAEQAGGPEVSLHAVTTTSATRRHAGKKRARVGG
ncbi:MAG: hypothetical protein SGJ01_11700, partial [Gemmatimonadota bacterium]|nr:hypothetical protein [Gemmatimonadota bacterium]